MISVLRELESKSTCLSRRVGCLILSSDGSVLSKGYNNHYKGISCKDTGLCLRSGSKSGENLDKCKIVHAEIDAIEKCYNIEKAHTIIITASPCINCIAELLKTNIKNIHFYDEYPHSLSKDLWVNSGRKWRKL